jgi:hypothetical protein
VKGGEGDENVDSLGIGGEAGVEEGRVGCEVGKVGCLEGSEVGSIVGLIVC